MFWRRKPQPPAPAPAAPYPPDGPPAVVAAVRGSLAADATRTRPVGRLHGRGGAGPAIAADWDACWLDGQPVATLADWADLLAANRLADVRGAFVVAWREPDGTQHLARDGLGERTLFYTPDQGGLAYGPSPGSLAALAGGRIDALGVARYLTYAYSPGPGTLVEGVRELLAGEHLTCRAGQVTSRRFWRLPAEGDEALREAGLLGHPLDEEGLRGHLRATLETAVRRRLAPGQPMAATLSGGIDSSLVVALAAALHDAPLHTYSIAFGPEHRDELPFSSLLARHCGTRHTVLELRPDAVVAYLDETIAALAEPNGDPLTVPNALLFREAAQVSGYVLNGEGGDPTFGGPKNLPMLLAELLGHRAPPGEGQTYVRERAYLAAHQKCYDELDALLAPDLRAAIAGDRLEAELVADLADPRFPTLVNRLMAVNVAFKGAHHILPKVDALSYPSGVLPRSPLFDRDVVATAFALPAPMKLRGAVEKWLLKEAVRDLVPQAIRDRPKSGMLVPVEGWFQGPLLPLARERLLEGLVPTGLVERRYVEDLLAGRLGGLRPRRGVKIWLLLTLEAWLRGQGLAK